MTKTIEEIKELCNCYNCKHSSDCPHRESFRRFPIEQGGTGACWNLKEQLGLR